MITQERLMELFTYCKDSGHLYVAKNRKGSSKKIGDITGSKTKNGYIEVDIDSKRYTIHRLAFLYVNGKFPDSVVDHINGDKSDNSWNNLRECSQGDNLQNIHKVKSTNTTGYTGVYVYKDKFRAKINIEGKQIHLGEFVQVEDAYAAYCAAKNVHHKYYSEISDNINNMKDNI